MQIGDKVKITKRTFLYQGIFIFTGAVVEIKAIDEPNQTAIVLYNDKEGHPHDLQMELADLTPL